MHSQLRWIKNYQWIRITILILSLRGIPRNQVFVLPKLLLLKPKRGKTIAAREKSHRGKEPWLEEKPPQKARNSKIQNLIFALFWTTKNHSQNALSSQWLTQFSPRKTVKTCMQLGKKIAKFPVANFFHFSHFFGFWVRKVKMHSQNELLRMRF